ncbi:hypothetical protein [Simplicispira psychrophila]|uniref:hypothetical protein n=1 Tax=Simplicispira psychrophila TaxID=80882 RepID=UPI0012EBC61D|nr:hypothetical protein [Simplicispira psychrophila]
MSDRPVPRFVSLHMAQMSSHLQQCRLARGSWYRLGCVAEAAHGFLAQRFVTTIALAVVLVVASGW